MINVPVYSLLNNFRPTASLLFLYSAAKLKIQRREIDAQFEGGLPKVFKKLAGDIFDEIARIGRSFKAEYNIGDLLEVTLLACLRLRWAVMIEYNRDCTTRNFDQSQESTDSSPTVQRLLGLDLAKCEATLISNETTQSMMKALLDIQLAPLAPSVHHMAASSRGKDEGAAFLKELSNGVQFDGRSPLAFLRSAPGDAWDIGIKVKVACSLTSEPLYKYKYILIDAKSVSESFEGPPVYPREPCGEQYRHVSQIMKKENLQLFFAYADTGASKDDGFEDAIVLGKVAMESLLGPMWPLYCTARSLIDRQRFQR
jgi:hypothetical protein